MNIEHEYESRQVVALLELALAHTQREVQKVRHALSGDAHDCGFWLTDVAIDVTSRVTVAECECYRRSSHYRAVSQMG